MTATAAVLAMCNEKRLSGKEQGMFALQALISIQGIFDAVNLPPARGHVVEEALITHLTSLHLVSNSTCQEDTLSQGNYHN